MGQPEPDHEAWADRYLDAHRTGPKRTQPGGGLDSLDDFWEEKRDKAAERGRRMGNLEGGFTIVGAILLAIFVFAFTSAF